MSSIEQKMSQVDSVLASLTEYYQSNPTPENEVLVEVPSTLIEFQLGLMYLLGHSGFGETEVEELAKLLEPRHPDRASRIRTTIPMVQCTSPDDREKVKQDCFHSLATGTNELVDVGRRLLRARELRAEGTSDGEIEATLATWKTENIF